MQFNAVTCCKHFMLLFVPSDPGKLQLKIYWHVGEGDKINRRQLQVPAFKTLSTHISFARKQENTAKDFMARMIAEVKELLKVTVSVYITSLQQTGRTIDRSFSPRCVSLICSLTQDWLPCVIFLANPGWLYTKRVVRHFLKCVQWLPLFPWWGVIENWNKTSHRLRGRPSCCEMQQIFIVGAFLKRVNLEARAWGVNHGVSPQVSGTGGGGGRSEKQRCSHYWCAGGTFQGCLGKFSCVEELVSDGNHPWTPSVNLSNGLMTGRWTVVVVSMSAVLRNFLHILAAVCNRLLMNSRLH